MSCIWVLAAESSRAKLYSAENRKAPLLEIGDFVHPESRLHEGDLVADQSGSDGGSVGQGRHVLDNKTNARDAERAEFAGMLADRLEAARKEDVFNRVVLIAPPLSLGCCVTTSVMASRSWSPNRLTRILSSSRLMWCANTCPGRSESRQR